MRPKRNPIVLLLTLVLAAAAVLLTPGAASAASPTATFVKTSEWGSAFEGSYTINNGGTTSINGWSVAFDLPSGASISSAWDATMSRNGQRFTFTNLGWNATIAPGASAKFGFIASPGSAVPANCTLNGASCGGTTDPSVPGKPGTPTATTTNSSIALSWAASTGTVTGYRVYEGTTVKATVTGTSATIASLGTCESHTYTVKAYNAQGESPASDPVTATTTGCTNPVPGKPGTPTATTTGSSIALSWGASSGTVTGYRVYEGTTVKATVTGTSATISSLGACETHTYTVKAYNAQGESPASDPVTATTTGCTGGGPLPKHFLTGYWHNFVNQAVALKLSAVPDEYDLVAVAFAEATATAGQLSFHLDPGLASAVGGYTEAQFKADIQALHARGKKVILSVGGELGRVQVASSQAATAFADSAYALMQTYGFDGVDIDLENGLNPTYMAEALRNLRTKAGADLIITMAPQTIDMQSTGVSYFQLALAIKDILTVVHTQFYNSGSMLGCDQAQAYSQGTVNFMTALACIQLENGLRPDQVALGLPAGPGAAGGGVVAPSLVNSALDCLAKRVNCGTFVPPRTYPGIRGAMTWSINWDASNNWNFSRTVKPHLATLP
ncbi:cellulose binding domain-containing protein [Sphaerisporangium sp. NPDC051011]|uniref:cellulose binding domain-containing protein n=1 Tax=Sphaerisporangium sp. NPDC051011 TaxID=3155792 RepID=UPI0033FE7EC2